MQLAQRYPAQRTVVTEADRHHEQGREQEDHHEVVHVLPVVVVGQLGRDDHGELAAAEDQRVEVGVKFAADILRAEDGLDPPDAPQHEESLEKTDEEAAHDERVGALGTGAEPTEEELQRQVRQQ